MFTRGRSVRPGIDQDPVVPWNWGTLEAHAAPVEIVSYPIPKDRPGEECREHERGKCDCLLMVRLTVGDPTSMAEVPLAAVAAFAPDKHEWFNRPKRYYSDNPTAFVFTDEVAA